MLNGLTGRAYWGGVIVLGSWGVGMLGATLFCVALSAVPSVPLAKLGLWMLGGGIGGVVVGAAVAD